MQGIFKPECEGEFTGKLQIVDHFYHLFCRKLLKIQRKYMFIPKRKTRLLASKQVNRVDAKISLILVNDRSSSRAYALLLLLFLTITS